MASQKIHICIYIYKCIHLYIYACVLFTRCRRLADLYSTIDFWPSSSLYSSRETCFAISICFSAMRRSCTGHNQHQTTPQPKHDTSVNLVRLESHVSNQFCAFFPWNGAPESSLGDCFGHRRTASADTFAPTATTLARLHD
eukprot:SAG31_NODE_6302_length_2074_cov_8.168101_2_plen_141_part_00